MNAVSLKSAAVALIVLITSTGGITFAQPRPAKPPADPTSITSRPQPVEPVEVETIRNRLDSFERRGWGPVVRVGTDYVLGAGETVDDVIVVSSPATIQGTVRGDVTVVLGSLKLASTSMIGGSLIVVGGSATIEPGAQVRQSLGVIGGALDAPPDFAPGREHVVIGGNRFAQRLQNFVPWLTEGLLLGRPIVPRLGWIWGIVIVTLLISLALTLMFLDAVRSCVAAIAKKPLSTFLVGLLVMGLAGPVSIVLAASVIGLAVVPFLLCALVIAWIVGKVGVDLWIGGSMVGQTPPDTRLQAMIALAIGFAVVCLAYMVPVLGFVVWALTGVLGLGAATLAFMAAFRSENPTPPKPAVPPPAPVYSPPVPAVAAEPAMAAVAEGAPAPATAPDLSTSLLSLPKAGFMERAAAFVLDLMLVLIAANILDFADRDGEPILLLLAYYIGFWTWKGTTLGGIICQLRLVRVDGQPLRFIDAFVRGLASLFSFAVLGLGCLWIVRDPDRQSWHDKIAGTYVVKVPRNWPVP